MKKLERDVKLNQKKKKKKKKRYDIHLTNINNGLSRIKEKLRLIKEKKRAKAYIDVTGGS